MSVTIAVWHLLVAITVILLGCMFIPVKPGDTYGVGAFLRGMVILIVIPVIWLGYFAGRFFIG